MVENTNAGLLRRIGGWFKRLRQVPPQRHDPWTGPRIYVKPVSGVRVDHDTALTYSAVWACVKIISEAVAGLSWNVFRDTGSAKIRMRDHPVSRILQVKPNPEMSAFTFREVMQAHLLLWGNAYAEIERDMGGHIIALWPLLPDRMAIDRLDNGALVYVYNPRGGERVFLRANDVLHVKGLGWDGLEGYSVIGYARESVGLGLATEKFGGAFFGNGTRPGGIFEHPATLGEEAHRRLKESLDEYHGGPSNAHKTLILEEGMKWHTVGVPPEDAQFLETRKFQATEIARWFRVPPHKIGDLDRATFSNIEHQSIEFVTDAVMPWVHRWEQAANTKLLRSADLVTRMNIKAMLRGDTESQYRALQIGFDRGWHSVDEVRELLDMNPIGGEEGNARVMQGAFKSIDDILNPPEPPAAPPPPPNGEQQGGEDEEDEDQQDENERSKRVFAELFADAANRIVSRERNALKKAHKRYVNRKSDYEAWIQSYYEGFADYVDRNVRAPAKAMVGIQGRSVDLDPIVGGFVESYIGRARRRAKLGLPGLSELDAEPGRIAVEMTEALSHAN